MSGAASQLSEKIRLSWDDPRFVLIVILGVGLAVFPIVAFYMDETFATNFVAKVLIFALAAVSLDFIMGYGGMVSFGHAAYIGLGSYAVAVSSKYAFDLCLYAESMEACEWSWLQSGFMHFPLAIIGSAVVALFIGAISIRTSGLYFIMITLAFTQMLFFLGISLEPFGGDDGMPTDPSRFFGVSLGDNVLAPAESRIRDDVLKYYAVFVSLIVCVFLLRRMVNSRFGMVLRGSQSNDARMRAIGFPTYRYRLVAFVIAGAMCGLAGALYANHQGFLTPEYMSWIQSGDLLFMVIMGGMGTIFGPIAGAMAFFGLEEALKGFSSIGDDYWEVVFGPLLVLLVIFARRGIFGLIPDRWANMGRFGLGLILFLLGFALFVWHLSAAHPLGIIATVIISVTIVRALATFFEMDRIALFATGMGLFILGTIITVAVAPEVGFSLPVYIVLAIDAALIVGAFAARGALDAFGRYFSGKAEQQNG